MRPFNKYLNKDTSLCTISPVIKVFVTWWQPVDHVSLLAIASLCKTPAEGCYSVIIQSSNVVSLNSPSFDWMREREGEGERERERERERGIYIYIYIYIYIKKNKQNRSYWHTFLVPSSTRSAKGQRKKYNTCQQQLCDHPLSQGTKAEDWGGELWYRLLVYFCLTVFIYSRLSISSLVSVLVPVSISLHLYSKSQNIIPL